MKQMIAGALSSMWHRCRRIFPEVTWGQPGGLPECPYFRRWVLDFGTFSLRIHRWYRADDDRALHDHPFWFWTLILRGGYADISEKTEGGIFAEMLYPGDWRFRPAAFKHTVQDVKPNTWTFLVTGPGGRRWGFWDRVTGKRVGRDKWFVTKGHHPCDETSKPVRMKPDGSRV